MQALQLTSVYNVQQQTLLQMYVFAVVYVESIFYNVVALWHATFFSSVLFSNGIFTCFSLVVVNNVWNLMFLNLRFLLR